MESDPEALDRIIVSARRMGVEIDEEEALQWLTGMAAARSSQGEVVMDTRSGVFGHSITMLDFSPEDLAHFREIGKLVEFHDIPGKVETALSLSGSSAQSKIQTYPGDSDFFERVNILAPTREEACRTLSQIMRQKALDTLKGPTYQFIEAKYGSYPIDFTRGGKTYKTGSPMGWNAEDVKAGRQEGSGPDGSPAVITWEDVMLNPDWCKLDWVIADPVRGELSNASNMLDVTWEAPDGQITPLDGYLDAYFQEVYLDASSIPIFSKLAKHVSADAMDHYVHQLEKEVNKYLTRDVNYGKAAKRMYNVFRLTGKYQEAAYIRELFDEPATVLYQVWSLIRTVDDAVQNKAGFAKEELLSHCDHLILSVINALEGAQESEIVKVLLTFRDAIARQDSGGLNTEAEAARSRVINIVNNFFHDRLMSLPEIKHYIDTVQSETKK